MNFISCLLKQKHRFKSQHGWYVVEDSLDICGSNINYRKLVVEAFNAAMDFNLPILEIIKTGRRIVNT